MFIHETTAIQMGKIRNGDPAENGGDYVRKDKKSVRERVSARCVKIDKNFGLHKK